MITAARAADDTFLLVLMNAKEFDTEATDRGKNAVNDESSYQDTKIGYTTESKNSESTSHADSKCDITSKTNRENNLKIKDQDLQTILDGADGMVEADTPEVTSQSGEGMPPRPLSAYNTFFRMERLRIIEGTKTGQDEEHEHTYTWEEVYGYTVQQRQQSLEMALANIPIPKRKHVKTHGKVSFTDLAKLIASRWRALSLDEQNIFRKCFQHEMDQYQRDLAIWIRKHPDQFIYSAETASTMSVASKTQSARENDPKRKRKEKRTKRNSLPSQLGVGRQIEGGLHVNESEVYSSTSKKSPSLLLSDRFFNQDPNSATTMQHNVNLDSSRGRMRSNHFDLRDTLHMQEVDDISFDHQMDIGYNVDNPSAGKHLSFQQLYNRNLLEMQQQTQVRSEADYHRRSGPLSLSDIQPQQVSQTSYGKRRSSSMPLVNSIHDIQTNTAWQQRRASAYLPDSLRGDHQTPSYIQQQRQQRYQNQHLSMFPGNQDAQYLRQGITGHGQSFRDQFHANTNSTTVGNKSIYGVNQSWRSLSSTASSSGNPFVANLRASSSRFGCDDLPNSGEGTSGSFASGEALSTVSMLENVNRLKAKQVNKVLHLEQQVALQEQQLLRQQELLDLMDYQQQKKNLRGHNAIGSNDGPFGNAFPQDGMSAVDERFGSTKPNLQKQYPKATQCLNKRTFAKMYASDDSRKLPGMTNLSQNPVASSVAFLYNSHSQRKKSQNPVDNLATEFPLFTNEGSGGVISRVNTIESFGSLNRTVGISSIDENDAFDNASVNTAILNSLVDSSYPNDTSPLLLTNRTIKSSTNSTDRHGAQEVFYKRGVHQNAIAQHGDSNNQERDRYENDDIRSYSQIPSTLFGTSRFHPTSNMHNNLPSSDRRIDYRIPDSPTDSSQLLPSTQNIPTDMNQKDDSPTNPLNLDCTHDDNEFDQSYFD